MSITREALLEALDPKWKHIATDDNGATFAYNQLPLIDGSDLEWWAGEDEKAECILLEHLKIIQEGDWKDSLVSRKITFGELKDGDWYIIGDSKWIKCGATGVHDEYYNGDWGRFCGEGVTTMSNSCEVTPCS